MSFLYPLGLLGLLGVPILIIIYVIKTKYTERTVPSTYLYRLSEKFLKRRNPISRVAGLISLILQILSVVLISLAASHPIIITPGGAYEYCFILDASGSMQQTTDGVSGFDRARAGISEIIDSSSEGSVYTLVVASDTAEVVYERISDRQRAKDLLGKTVPADTVADYQRALSVAQGYFNDNGGLKTYFFTDSRFDRLSAVEVVNIAHGDENYSIDSLTATLKGGGVEVVGNILSHTSDGEIVVSVSLRGREEYKKEISVSATCGVPVEFSVSFPTSSYDSVSASILTPDSLYSDSEYVLFNEDAQNLADVLIVSDTPHFISGVISAGADVLVDVLSTSVYSHSVNGKGYGLYVYHNFTPESMPADGAVWLVNPKGNLEGAGFGYQGAVLTDGGAALELTESSSTSAKRLTANMSGKGIFVSEYVKCSLHTPFTVLLSCEGSPVVFAGTNEYGNREAVFAFDIHSSNLPILADFVFLVNNLIEYSFPEVVEDVDYSVGDSAAVNLLPGCDSIRVVTPDGGIIYPDKTSALCEFSLTEAGVYRIIMDVDGSEREFNIFASFDKDESKPYLQYESAILSGVQTKGALDGRFDTMNLLFILLAITFVADWGVYCYDKYRLR